MPDRNSTAPNYVPATNQPDWGAFIPREQRPTVVMASNAASDWKMVLLAGVFLALMTLVVWMVAHFAFHLHRGWSAIIALLAFAACGRFALIIVNGDWVAHREIGANERVERRRLDEASDVAHRHYDLLTAQEAHRHVEAMASIESHTTDGRLRQDVAWLVEQMAVMRRALPLESKVEQPTHRYVPAQSSDARNAVETWLMGLWDREGNRKFVQGQLPMPWNGNDWRGQPWCDEARAMLLDAGIVVQRSGGRTFTVVPNSRRDAMTLLDTLR